MSRQCRSAARVLEKQAQQKEQHDAHACERKLGIGQAVMACAFSSSTHWLPGVVTRQIGPLTYLIQLTDGTVWRRHIDQLQARGDVPESLTEQEPELSEREEEDSLTTPETQPAAPTLPDTPVVQPEISETPLTSESSSIIPDSSSQAEPTPQPVDTSNQPQRSGRKQNKPNRYM